ALDPDRHAGIGPGQLGRKEPERWGETAWPRGTGPEALPHRPAPLPGRRGRLTGRGLAPLEGNDRLQPRWPGRVPCPKPQASKREETMRPPSDSRAVDGCAPPPPLQVAPEDNAGEPQPCEDRWPRREENSFLTVLLRALSAWPV